MKNILQNFGQSSARKNLSKCGGWIIVVPLFMMALSMLFSARTFGQSYIVKGNVAIRGTVVRYASVTFVNTGDTTMQFSTLTDTMGNFQLDLTITSVKPNNSLPTNFELEQNYPNPFSSSTAISYQLNKQSNVRVTIYDVLGREIKGFNVGFQTPGAYGVVWDGKNDFGRIVTPGVYFYRLQAEGKSQVKKMVYGLGGRSNSIVLPGIVSSQASDVATHVGQSRTKGVSDALAGVAFTVLIAGTDSTSPAIIAQQFNNVGIKSDTTLDYIVSPVPLATVYLDSTEQIIRGFGGANTLIFRPDMTPAEVQTAFGNGIGQIGMTIMRLSIPPDSTQYSPNATSALAAQNLGAIIIATPWTPPAWMKSNNSESGGILLPANYAAYAAHLKAFADTMAAYGVSLYGISVQNEPDATVGYQSCGWSATQFLNFMKYNAPSVGVPVFMPESESFIHQLSDSTLNDSVAASHVAFIGGHIYGATPSTYPLAFSKGKEQWMTEYLINSGSSTLTSLDTGWTGAIQTAKSINDCMSANMSTYVWWYIVRYYGPIDDGTDGGVTGSVTKKGYVMSQYAKFVRPGFYRVYATLSSGPNAYVTAYKEGTKVVIVVVNMGSSSLNMTFSLLNGAVSTLTPYVTSGSKNCTEGNIISVSGGNFTTTVDASSVTTFVSN
ncbi:MAG: T9SS type A sorting domain-containing protein [Bacteroidota bacterium]